MGADIEDKFVTKNEGDHFDGRMMGRKQTKREMFKILIMNLAKQLND
jgi:hypothetical protein